jgi:beta-glucanase (GH16 family)
MVDLMADDMTLVGSDEFTGSANSRPNAAYWNYETGAGGWGNNELQTYTDTTQNVRLSGDGNLIIEARKNGSSYTSGRLTTKGKAEFGYGLIEARIKMPEGQGLLPAFWTLGNNVDTAGWPAAGEIDIMELLNTGTKYHNGVHGPLTADPRRQWTLGQEGSPGVNLANDYYTYQLYREPGRVLIGINGQAVGEYRRDTMPAGAQWVFDGPVNALLNVAVGGNWPGSPNSRTVFPATMRVDWLRYWQKS